MTKSPAPQPYRSGRVKDEARMKFATWLALPESQRKPATQDELAKELGVARSTLSEWRRLPMMQAIAADFRNSYRASFGLVMDAVMKRARNGNIPAARLAAEILGEMSPTRVEQTNIDSPFGQLLNELRDMRAKPLESGLKVIDGGKVKRAESN